MSAVKGQTETILSWTKPYWHEEPLHLNEPSRDDDGFGLQAVAVNTNLP